MNPRISLVAAMAEGGVIGVDNRLPWRLPADLRHFKQTTLGHPLLMGRRTFESLGRSLPERTNIVVTATPGYEAPGGIVVGDINTGLAAAAEAGEEIMVIGGASFYEQLLPRAERLYLTLIHHTFPGDAYFPTFEPSHWRLLSHDFHWDDTENPYPYTFMTLARDSSV